MDYNNLTYYHAGILFIIVGIIGPFVTLSGFGLGVGVILIIVGVCFLAASKVSKPKKIDDTKKTDCAFQIRLYVGMDIKEAERCIAMGDAGLRKIAREYARQHCSPKNTHLEDGLNYNSLVSGAFLGFSHETCTKVGEYYKQYLNEFRQERIREEERKKEDERKARELQ